jgi:O-antigen biosynthesis protein
VQSLTLSIVIVNWNVKNCLQLCLESVYKTILDEKEIIVVDNDSRDGSIEMIKEKFPKVSIIENNENVGFAKANNQAFNRCKGKYILILNPDTILLEESISKLIDKLEMSPEIAMAGPKMEMPDGIICLACRRETFDLVKAFKVIWSIDPLVEKITRNLFIEKYNKFLSKYERSEFVEAISGACMLIKNDALQEVGFFDEIVPLYLDDMDLCIRVNQKFKIAYVAESKVIHQRGASTKLRTNSHLMSLMMSYASYQFLNKHTHWLSKKSYLLLLGLSSILMIFGIVSFSPILIFTKYFKTAKQMFVLSCLRLQYCFTLKQYNLDEL